MPFSDAVALMISLVTCIEKCIFKIKLFLEIINNVFVFTLFDKTDNIKEALSHLCILLTFSDHIKKVSVDETVNMVT